VYRCTSIKGVGSVGMAKPMGGHWPVNSSPFRSSPHDLRHTYATILLMAHISPAYVQKQLGHHSISMTVDIYGHWIPGEGRERLDNALRPKAKTGKPLNLVMHGQD
jgi:integrase